MKNVCLAGLANDTRIRRRNAALTANVAVSTAIAHPGLESAMTTPAAAGPAIAVTLRESDIRPFAC